MELEKEKPSQSSTSLGTQKPYQTQPTKTFVPIKKNYSQEVCVVMGVAFLVIGFVGFVVDNLLGAHLSYAHNAIHVISGLLALWYGFDSVQNAKRFSYTFGALYGALGIVGFLIGTRGMPSLGALTEDRFLWRVVPDILELGTVDHSLHVLFGFVFILGAALNFKKMRNI